MSTNSTDQRQSIQRYELRNRYVFKGQLVMQTALHIGGGKVTLSNSNSPVVLTPEQKPFIPGSSFKGALRSTVEKLAPNLPGFTTCALIERDEKEIKSEMETAEATNQPPVCSTIRQAEFAKKRREKPAEASTLIQTALDELCDTCRLFGSPFAAAHLNVNDLYMPDKDWGSIIQRRDGVAIDRDSEKAKDRLKYDFEVVPASAAFSMEIVLENATPKDLQLICVGLSEFVHGFGVIGGKRSRGLGVCLLKNLKVSELDLSDQTVRHQRLHDYLLGIQPEEQSGEKFLETHINNIFEGGRDVKKTGE